MEKKMQKSLQAINEYANSYHSKYLDIIFFS